MQEDQISVEFIVSYSYVYFTHKEGKSQFTCLQTSKGKLFMGAGGLMFLATADQKRALKVGSCDASIPLLTLEWVDLAFQEVWLVFHAHTGVTLF